MALRSAIYFPGALRRPIAFKLVDGGGAEVQSCHDRFRKARR